MPERRVLFRCDAGAEIGGGHVMRCLTLATEMAAAGWMVGFAVTEETLTVTPAARFGGFDLTVLADKDDLPGSTGRYDLAVVDHYGLGAGYETHLRSIAAQIAVIDDFPTRPHDCDLLIDQNFGRSASDYCGTVPRAAQVLTGTPYALLRAEFGAARSVKRSAHDHADAERNILVSLGLTDVGGITGNVVGRLLAMNLRARLDVVIGPAAPSRVQLEALAARGEITLHIAADNMAALMARADLCVGAGGTTSWERCCLGLPTVLLVLADNQTAIAASLAEAGAAVSLTEWSGGEFEAAVGHLTDDGAALRAMGAKAAALCDGAGVARVETALSDLAERRRAEHRGALTPRVADAGDRADLWLWRNHPRARAVSLSGDVIPWQDHCAWYETSLTNKTRIMLMIEQAGEAIGYVRLDHEDGAWLVSIAMAPARYGAGLGAATLAAGLRHLPGARFRADIHRDNTAAQRIFASCGFIRARAGDDQFDVYEKHEDAA